VSEEPVSRKRCELAWAIGLLVWGLGMVLAFAQSSYHDPALDTLNNNLGYVSSDINGNFQEQNRVLTNVLPGVISEAMITNSAMSMSQGGRFATNFENSIRDISGVNLQFRSYVVSGGKTNAGALTNVYGGMMATNIQPRLTGGSNGIPTIGDIHNTADRPVSNIGVTISIPSPKFLAAPSGYPPTLGVTYLDMRLGDLGDWTVGAFTATQVATAVRNLILGIVLIVYFFKFLTDVKNTVGEALNQRQMQGAKDSLIGTKVSSIFAFAYSAHLTAALLLLLQTVLVFGITAVALDFGSISSWRTSALAFFDSIPAWKLLTLFVPVWEIILSHLLYLISRSLLLQPMFLLVRMLILWLPA